MGKRFRSFAFVATLAGLAALVACGGGSNSGGGGGGTTPPPVNGALTVLPGSVSIPVGQTVQFTAYQNNAATTSSWSATSGTISSSGLFTASSTAGTATITATAGSNGGTTTVQIVAAQPITVSPSALTIPAGGVQAFTASSTGVSWTVNNGIGNCLAPAPGAQGQCYGIIDANGNYQAPLAPPAGGSVTITAAGAAGSGTAAATILFSAASLTSNGGTGQYVIAFAGVDLTKGYPIDVAGVINTVGSATSTTGSIVPGGELDINSLNFGVTAAQITGGTFQVGPVDGRTSLTITNSSSSSSVTSFTLQVALVNSQHALLIDFDTFATGSGTLDAQNTLGFNTLSGNYSFSLSGVDTTLGKSFSKLVPVYVAGTFLANGNSIPVNPTNSPTNTQDVVDNSLVTPVLLNDQTLNGLFSDPDANGRGTMSMSSTVFTTVNFAYYVIDSTHMKIVETDQAQSYAMFGDIYSAPKTPTPLTGGVAFTANGSTLQLGPYVSGGVFAFSTATSSTSTSITGGGQIDVNSGLQSLIGTTIQSGSLTNDTGTGFVPSRYLLSLTTNNSSSTLTFSAYMTNTTPPSALIIETDNFTAGATGQIIQQTAGGSNTGSYAMSLTGVGNSKSITLFEQDISGQIGLTANSETVTGTLDINNSATSTTTINSASVNTVWFLPVATNGRGTAIWTTQNGAVFKFACYVVNGGTVLLLDTDSNRVATGVMARQF